MIKEFQKLASDHTSGATELIRKLLALCENCAIGYRFDELREGFALLEKAQPSMPSLHAVLHILKSEFVGRLQKDEETAEAIAYLSSLENILNESGTRISEIFAETLTEAVSAVTLSRSSTVLSTLYHLREQTLLRHVYVLEGRPMLEGHRSIRDLDDHRIAATLMIDAAMGEALQHADIAVVGADTITADGFLLNKTGTYPLALCCRAMEKPLYVFCDSLKFSPQLREQITVESRPAEEVLSIEDEDSFGVWNHYFEWTPVEFITAFITERGSFAPEQLSALAPDSEK